MPIERVSRGFKDISMTFGKNPITNDLLAIKDANAISRSVQNIILTTPGERFFQPSFGTDIQRSLFNNMDALTASSIEGQIKNSLENYEPRVKIRKLEVNPNFESNTFDTTITYDIIGADVPPQQLQFALQSAR